MINKVTFINAMRNAINNIPDIQKISLTEYCDLYQQALDAMKMEIRDIQMKENRSKFEGIVIQNKKES